MMICVNYLIVRPNTKKYIIYCCPSPARTTTKKKQLSDFYCVLKNGYNKPLFLVNNVVSLREHIPTIKCVFSIITMCLLLLLSTTIVREVGRWSRMQIKVNQQKKTVKVVETSIIYFVQF